MFQFQSTKIIFQNGVANGVCKSIIGSTTATTVLLP